MRPGEDFGTVGTFDVRFAEAIAASAEAAAKLADALPPAPSPPARPITSDATTSGDRVRAEAADLAPGPFGMLLWVEAKRIKAGLDPLDAQWLWHFDTFYASGKPVDVGRFGLRAAKSWSVCTALVAESLLMPRRLAVVGRCPIMSKDKYEANDRFVTLCEVLRAVGLSEIVRGDPDSGSFKTSGGGSSPYSIELFDFDGHPIEFRTQAASVGGAAGFTGIAGFGDELDLWGKPDGANPAKQVVEVLVTRYTTQFKAGARLHLMSATYDRSSYHAKLISNGDDALHYVARLGEVGAAKDIAARRQLARETGIDDPLLLAPADPNSPNIPSWVSNPVTPIDSCLLGANYDLRRMFSLYGARPEFAGAGSPLGDVTFAPSSDTYPWSDVVIAISPPESAGPWAAIVAAWGPGGVTICEDLTGHAFCDIVDHARATLPAASVFVAHAKHAKHAAQMVATVRAMWVPAVAEVDVYDGGALRTGPLVTRYAAGRVRHAPGLDTMEKRLRAFDPEKRDPVVEAVVCAVERLASCYDAAGDSYQPGPQRGRVRGMMEPVDGAQIYVSAGPRRIG